MTLEMLFLVLSLLFLTPTWIWAETPPIRFLLPNGAYSLRAEKELNSIAEDYNRLHPGEKVILLKRGDEFSTLRDLMALHMAGAPPDIAAIESSEQAALERYPIAVTGEKIRNFTRGMKAWALKRNKNKKGEMISIPFQISVPVLIADQEMLFRAHVDPEKMPTTWAGLRKLAEDLSTSVQKLGGNESATTGGSSPENSEERYALALPLLGPRGLWIFEALAGKPLWIREAGGVRSNRSLKPEITVLQEIIDHPHLARPAETTEQALQAFLDRQAPLFVGSLDLIPYISNQATFRWTVAPLPRISGGFAESESGSHLLVLNDSQPVWNFLRFLYAPENAARWVAASGALPLDPSWETSVHWKKAIEAIPPYRKVISRLQAQTGRTTDVDLVQCRSDWIQALVFLFSDKARRPTSETLLNQLDSHLTAR